MHRNIRGEFQENLPKTAAIKKKIPCYTVTLDCHVAYDEIEVFLNIARTVKIKNVSARWMPLNLTKTQKCMANKFNRNELI